MADDLQDRGTPYWDDQDEDGVDDGDLCYWAGGPMPGIAEVKTKTGYRVDQKDGQGTNGATLTVHGAKLGTATITLRMWKQSHRESCNKLLEALRPPQSKKPATPFDFDHPELDRAGLRSMFVESIDGPTRADTGIYTLVLNCIEFRSPPAKPKGSATSTPNSAHQADHPNAPNPNERTPAPYVQPPPPGSYSEDGKNGPPIDHDAALVGTNHAPDNPPQPDFSDPNWNKG